jgi:hypothetical protein
MGFNPGIFTSPNPLHGEGREMDLSLLLAKKKIRARLEQSSRRAIPSEFDAHVRTHRGFSTLLA